MKIILRDFGSFTTSIPLTSLIKLATENGYSIKDVYISLEYNGQHDENPNIVFWAIKEDEHNV